MASPVAYFLCIGVTVLRTPLPMQHASTFLSSSEPFCWFICSFNAELTPCLASPGDELIPQTLCTEEQALTI